MTKIRGERFLAVIETDNAAFQDGNLRAELKRIAQVIDQKIDDGQTSGKCMDINGNSVGSWEIK